MPPRPPPYAEILTETHNRVDYMCAPFYSLSSGSHVRECGLDGSWSGEQPVCIPICGIGGAMDDELDSRPRRTSRKRSRRVVGGHDSLVGAWPWQVMLERANGDLWCGGSLLSERTVITAAHCVQRYEESESSSLIVRVGAHTRLTPSIVEQVATIEDVVIHPDYKPDNYDSDVALIHLTKPIRMSSFARPVCLPYSGSKSLLQPGTVGFVTGWGKQRDLNNHYPNVLQQVAVPVVSTSTCNGPRSHRGAVTNNMVCAGLQQGGRDACDADSGGPLVVRSPINGRYVLAGITSWGSGCGEPDKYGVYAKVSNFVDWIAEHMKR